VITQGTYSHITTLVLISFVVMKSIVVKFHVDVPIRLTIGIPSHTIITTTLVPQNPGGNPLDPLRGVAITSVHLTIPYYRPYKRPLNYHEYKKILIHMLMYKYLKPPLKLTMKWWMKKYQVCLTSH
jgi:hypothetical protein